MIQMLRAGNWLAYEQFVRRFIDEVVSVVISRNELDRRFIWDSC